MSAQLGPFTIIVDGYNMIRATPGLAVAEARGGLAAGRAALLAQTTATYRHTPHRVLIVFDGAGPAVSSQPIPGLPRGTTIYTRAGESADALILRLAAEEAARGHQVKVVSNDAEIRRESGGRGADAVAADALERRLNEAPRYLRQRMRHKRGVLQRQDTEDEDGEPRRIDRAGNPARARRRPRDAQRGAPPL